MEVNLSKLYKISAYAAMSAMFGLILAEAPVSDAVANHCIARPPTPGANVCSALMPGVPEYTDCVANWEKSLNCKLPNNTAFYNHHAAMDEARCKAAGGVVYLPK